MVRVFNNFETATKLLGQFTGMKPVGVPRGSRNVLCSPGTEGTASQTRWILA